MNILEGAFAWLKMNPLIFTCIVIFVVLEGIRSTFATLRKMKYPNAAARAVGRARAEGKGQPSSEELQKAINIEIEAERNNPTSHMWNQIYSRSSFPIALFALGALYAVWRVFTLFSPPLLGAPYLESFISAFLIGTAAVLLFRGTAALINPLTDPVWIGVADRSSIEYKLQLRMLLAALGIFLTTATIAFITQTILTNV